MKNCAMMKNQRRKKNNLNIYSVRHYFNASKWMRKKRDEENENDIKKSTLEKWEKDAHQMKLN